VEQVYGDTVDPTNGGDRTKVTTDPMEPVREQFRKALRESA